MHLLLCACFFQSVQFYPPLYPSSLCAFVHYCTTVPFRVQCSGSTVVKRFGKRRQLVNILRDEKGMRKSYCREEGSWRRRGKAIFSTDSLFRTLSAILVESSIFPTSSFLLLLLPKLLPEANEETAKCRFYQQMRNAKVNKQWSFCIQKRVRVLLALATHIAG